MKKERRGRKKGEREGRVTAVKKAFEERGLKRKIRGLFIGSSVMIQRFNSLFVHLSSSPFIFLSIARVKDKKDDRKKKGTNVRRIKKKRSRKRGEKIQSCRF